MSESEPVFTSWKQWAQRGNIGNAGGPGVYLLAHIPQGSVPDGSASPLDERIVYIGETHRQTLAKRWGDFDRSARTGNRGHAGGRTYHERFRTIQSNLYVAAYTPGQSDWTPRCRSFFLRYIESKLVCDFVSTYRPDGLCNKG